LVERTEVVKGYEYEKGQYLLIEGEEIKKLSPETSGTMEIGEFLPLAEIDPVYFDTSYLAVPEASGAKAYRLLVETMEQTQKAALAKVAMHQREYLVAIRPREHGLTLHTMHFNNEIRTVSEYGHTDAEVRQEEIKLAKELVENLSTHFKPERYHDEYQAKLRALLDAKLKGKKVSIAEEHKMAPVIDMVEALKKSLAKREQASSKASRSAARQSHGSRVRRKAS
jgi:DNA end-binding protein Ku